MQVNEGKSLHRARVLVDVAAAVVLVLFSLCGTRVELLEKNHLKQRKCQSCFSLRNCRAMLDSFLAPFETVGISKA